VRAVDGSVHIAGRVCCAGANDRTNSYADDHATGADKYSRAADGDVHADSANKDICAHSDAGSTDRYACADEYASGQAYAGRYHDATYNDRAKTHGY
jgi:hypothetical protein